MVERLHKYLILYKKLSLPGVGSFTIQQTNASVDVAGQIIYPPLPVISFGANTLDDDKHLQQYLSHENPGDALQIAKTIKENLSHQKHASLNGIGSLQKDENDNIIFQPAYTLQDYFPAITAERVIYKNAAHTMLVGDAERTNLEMQDALTKPVTKAKDRWVLYAVLLAAAGIAALIYYHAIH